MEKGVRTIQQRQKGFTLLELLIVVAILAILSGVTIIVLNPSEMLRRARDAQRVSDLKTIAGAMGIWITGTSSPTLSDDDALWCKDQPDPDAIFSHMPGLSAPGPTWIVLSTTSQAVDGSGWLRVNFTSLSTRAPIAKIPVDPVSRGPAAGGNNDFYFTYACNKDSVTFELNANLESSFYQNGGPGDIESMDGGDWASIFEVGNQLNLLPNAAATGYYEGE
ncbi:MAG: prepilin-type N-terminal cleavage/methylation domain-containing protein [Parcubacteria group bacterium]|nr:prepilin-type N-terminal cleavage/methylation domain-containing protein [Parcubacteria group bacterium]